jgi:hypothetical protein
MDSRENLQKDIRRLERFATAMDSRWRLPFTNIYWGYDALIGLIPILGDAFTALTSVWLINKISTYELSGWVYFKMAKNILVDLLLGLVPVIGDLLDVAYRANKKNVDLLKLELEKLDNIHFSNSHDS